LENVKSRSIPRFDSRTVFSQGNAMAITVHEGWLKQHHLSKGDEVHAFLDEDNERFILIAEDEISKELLEKAESRGLPHKKRRVTGQGGGYGIYIPSGWIRKLKIGKGEDLMVRSDNAMSFEVFTPEKKEEYHKLFEVEI